MAGFINSDDDKPFFPVIFKHINTAGILLDYPEGVTSQVHRRQQEQLENDTEGNYRYVPSQVCPGQGGRQEKRPLVFTSNN